MPEFLDVVVPAWRTQHLSAALESLARQEDRHFRVLVGDDASLEDLESVCSRFAGRMDIRYHRFAENLGACDLVSQWNRCVMLGDSPWIWLFSDDDVASSGCVGALRKTLDSGAPIARLDLRIVDSVGEAVDVFPEPSERESRGMFLWQRLKRRRESFAAEYGFSRNRWEAMGGFVQLPAAWCSDDASWWMLAGGDGIRRAVGGRVDWRWSGTNISASHRRDAEKREACVRFLELIGREGLREMETSLGLVPGAGSSAAASWFRFHMEGLRVHASSADAISIQERLCAVLGDEASGLSRMLRNRNLRLVADRLRGRFAKDGA